MIKKTILLFFSFCLIGSNLLLAQTKYEIPRHEINLNLVNTLIIGSVEVGYNYFIDYDQSIGLKALVNDRRNFRPERSGSKYSTHALQLNYSYYFGKENPGSGVYVQPMMKFRIGDFKEKYSSSSGSYAQKTNMNAFIIGIGGGYIWNISNSFVFGPYFNIGRNFSKPVKERFSAAEIYAGFDIGYRF